MDEVQVETMADRKLLVETLSELSSEELEEFKSLIEVEEGFPLVSKSRLRVGNPQDVVELMVETYSHKGVEVIKQVLKKMNKTDLVQRLSDASSETKDTQHFVDEQQPALIQKEETMMSVIELLLATLANLSNTEIKDFKLLLLRQIDRYKRYSAFTWRMLRMTNMQDTVFLIVQTFGQQSVERTKEILVSMKRTDLVQRLSDSSSGPKKMYPVDEYLTAIIHKVATMTAVKELLLETLNNLSYNEFEKFRWLLQLTYFQKGFPQIQWSRLQRACRADQVVDVMVEWHGQQSVKVTMEVFMDMNKTDLIQRLSEISSGLKAAGSSDEVFGSREGEKHSVNAYWPALIQKEETMVAIIELLLETLNDLSDMELNKFRKLLLDQIHLHKPYSDIPWRLLEIANMEDTVFLIVQTFSQQSMERTKEILETLNRTDLVQRLSDSSSGCKKKLSVSERCLARIQKVATMAAYKHLLSETLNDLSDKELEKFNEVLHSIVCETDISWMCSLRGGQGAGTVDVMVDTFYSHLSVEVITKVFMNMKRTDLVKRLSDTSSRPKVQHSGEEHRPALSKRVLLETLNDLSQKKLKTFKWFLQFTHFQRGIPQIPWSQLEGADTQEIVDLMMEICGQQSVEVIREVFMDMNRTDVMQCLSEKSSGSKVKHQSSILQIVTKKFTKKKKKMNRADLVLSSEVSLETKDKQRLPLIQKEEEMVSDIELLLATLADLTKREITDFKCVIWSQFLQYKRDMTRRIFMLTDMQDTVFLLVEVLGQQSVKKTTEILKNMKRTDLVQRLSDSSSRPKNKHSVDERLSALIHKVASMAVVKEWLWETLTCLSHKKLKIFKWLLQFTYFQKGFPCIKWRQLKSAHKDEIVDLMVEMCGQQSVVVTIEVLVDMNRADLVQMLSETSSGHKEKHAVDDYWPALIQKEETMASVIELLLETLADLNNRELKNFRHEIHDKCNLDVPWFQSKMADIQNAVFFVVQTYGQKSVERTEAILKRMNRTDLMQRLSDSSSASTKKHSQCHSALIQKVATMAAYKHLLLESLNELSCEDLEKFNKVLKSIVLKSGLPVFYVEIDREKTVMCLVEHYGKESVEVMKKVFTDMNRTDLVEKLSGTSSRPKEKCTGDEHQTPLFKREAAQQISLEMLNYLRNKELEKFKVLLQFTFFQKCLPQIPLINLESLDRADMVHMVMDICGQQSVDVIREVLTDMNRTDLVEKLSETSSGHKEKHRSPPFEEEATMTPIKKKLLEALEDLSDGTFEQFRWVLQNTKIKRGLPTIPSLQGQVATRVDIVELMAQMYGQQSVDVAIDALSRINRNDLMKRLSDFSSGSKALPLPPQSVLHSEPGKRKARLRETSPLMYKNGCPLQQESSDWTKLEPEVNSTDADETYSLQSEAGTFECSVSGLRWVCEEKVSIKYQFCSWEGHMERMESRGYMPAGPLMDITVDAGKLDEVYLPHWVCIDDNPTISDKFAVLHIDDCGDVVEKACEVKPSHVKLSKPVFSPRAVLMKAGLSVKVNCNVLLYKTNTAFLTLHVYLIPRDPALQKAMDKRELTYGYKIIRKPHPEKSLKMRDRFILTADLEEVEIYPENLKLRYESREPNFFEMFNENPGRNFKLSLTQEDEAQPVWTCVIRKDEYQSSGHTQGKHFVDEHQCDLIDRVSNIGPILDNLLREGVIQQEEYDQIRASPTTQEKMRKLYGGPLKAGGHESKDIFYKTLEEKEPCLVADLKRKES